MNYTVTVYSEIDRSILETHYFVSHAEARAEKSRLEAKYCDDLCVVEIKEVGYEEQHKNVNNVVKEGEYGRLFKS